MKPSITALNALLPDLKELSKESLTLLNSPIFTEGIEEAVSQANQVVSNICNRIQVLDAHTALFFLTNHTSAPRLNYLLRTAPLYQRPDSLSAIDQVVRDTATKVTNVELDASSWRQASLPIRYGGLGLRSINSLALPCYISSLTKSQPLVQSIIKQPPSSKSSHLLQAEAHYIRVHPSATLPLAEAATRQRSWDEQACQAELNNLLSSANQVHSARLRAAASPHTGAWLQALPSPSLGLLLDEETVRVNVALRLGAPICEPHKCRCGRLVGSLGHHGLACRLNEGRQPRHYAPNE